MAIIHTKGANLRIWPAYRHWARGRSLEPTQALISALQTSNWSLLTEHNGRNLTPRKFIEAVRTWVDEDPSFETPTGTRELLREITRLPIPMCVLAYTATGDGEFAASVSNLVASRLLNPALELDDTTTPPPPDTGAAATALLEAEAMVIDGVENESNPLYVQLVKDGLRILSNAYVALNPPEQSAEGTGGRTAATW